MKTLDRLAIAGLVVASAALWACPTRQSESAAIAATAEPQPVNVPARVATLPPSSDEDAEFSTPVLLMVALAIGSGVVGMSRWCLVCCAFLALFALVGSVIWASCRRDQRRRGQSVPPLKRELMRAAFVVSGLVLVGAFAVGFFYTLFEIATSVGRPQ